MYLRLLGPFELTAPTGAVRVPGRGERALLAVLALSPREVMTDTVLIEQLWSESDQPADPMNALQTRVSKVRRVLAAAAAGGAPLVIRQGSGYRLDLDRQSVDVHCFASLIDAAHRAGDADQAIGCYDQALALWRAEPFADFAGDPWAAVEAARLVEQRLVAITERAERMLTLGRYDELVADLAPVVAAAPTRERLVGQLMTGLFNAGRQADALEVYARTREVLADELGLDPSRELRGVMQQILCQDSAITPAPTATGSDWPAGLAGQEMTPAAGNLPLRLTSFVGREEDVARVTAALQRARLVTLAGPGGGGKTTLALEAARHNGHGFRDGAWLVRLAPVTEPDSLPHAVADGLGLSIEGGTVAHRPRDVLILGCPGARC
jgi:DNA-binding SARP family transcriptional activator